MTILAIGLLAPVGSDHASFTYIPPLAQSPV